MPVVDLTDRFCASAKAGKDSKGKPARADYFDAKMRGLALRVATSGIKTFTLHYGPANRRQRFTIGRYPTISLARARTLALEALGRVHDGQHPRQTDPALLGEVAEKYIAEHLGEKIDKQGNRTYAKRRGQRDAREIRKFIIPPWRTKPIVEITPEDVKALIRPLARKTPAQAHLILNHVKRIWSWAVNSDVPYGIVQSPAHLLKPKALIGERKVRTRVLSDKEIGAYWRAAEKLGYPVGDMYRLIMLTGVRIAEASEAQWSEFNLADKLWTVPPERFKSGQEHPIPLSKPAVTLIKSLPRGADGDFIFSTTNGKRPIGDFSDNKSRLDAIMAAELGELEHFVTHDVRRTVRTRMSEMHVDDKIAEMVIGHGKRGLARVYDQARHLPAMREALDNWATKLAAIVRATA